MSHLYEEKLNNQGCLMKIIEYNNNSDLIVEFQDKYMYRKHTQYCNFKSGSIRNPYYPNVYGLGITGLKYPTKINGMPVKEYVTWIGMLRRSFAKTVKDRQPTYQNVTCCEEWLSYESFYEWLHSQPNFDKWYNGKRWALDKDILNKGNKLYSQDSCCLVPQNVNCVLLKREAERGRYPIGVKENEWGFEAKCHNPFTNRSKELGCYATPERAFEAYKRYKEDIVKQVAKQEYDKENITKECYEEMMNYEVEITD